ncbi:transcriptional regulator [Desulfosporosinus acidiphilus SJ4]|uniref:siroheme decarboxylase n=1 Tax=Desulfosporosinus acidiphilus (strain DSM 22704 / JCM 16185 / SJ4) TaxID=646529 RepID=I4D539_DESAJ|nr:Lrp/AsnC family transcriptional regulator [Desulfosporosinus acidiphilus]AFM40913.1 transcriptional regulator [Desulfosporosinus acidiphilus SJ4]
MDSADRTLLNEIQKQFPIEVHPYEILGIVAGITEENAFTRIQRLRREGIIRRLGGVFDSRKLGYYSTLCAAKVPEEKISDLADLLNKIPGVTHNYIREHDYNVWFTLIARSEEVAERIIQRIRTELEISEVFSLPATRLFKINVNFDFSEEEDAQDDSLSSPESGEQGSTNRGSSQPFDLTDADISLIQMIQGDLPDSPTPFTVLAEKLNWPVEKLISRAKDLLDAKVLRRFGAVLRHQKAGFVANSMGVWQVELDRAEEVGKIMAQFKEVSHCYQRPTLSDWPYNLFTMIHGKTMEDCDEIMKRISAATGVTDYSMLFSTAELKKSSMQYFLEEETF